MRKILLLFLFLANTHPLHTLPESSNDNGVDSAYLIPKIIHQIWVGKNKIHPACLKAMETVKDNHPTWEYKLWTDDDIDSFPWVNRELFDNTENPGAKSDIWRYEILNLYGGVYLDVDFISLNPLDDIHRKYKFYAGIVSFKKNRTPLIANGIFGSIPNHPILQDLVERIKDIKAIDSSDATDIMHKIGPDFFTDSVNQYFINVQDPQAFIFRRKSFFPIHFKKWEQLEKLDYKITKSDLDFFRSQGCYTVHLYARSWVPSKQDRWKDCNPIIPKIIHQIWVGNNEIHPQSLKAMQSLRDNHPEWEYKLWTDDDIDSFPWVNRELFDNTENPGAKSDIWRYEILNLYGGVYLDVDFISLNPLDEIHQKYSFYSCIVGDIKDDGSFILANGVFGSIPNHPILEDLVEKMKKIEYIDSINCDKIMETIGPMFFTKVSLKYLKTAKDPLLKIFRPQFFFPIHPTKWRYLEEIDYIIPQSYIKKFRSKGYYTIHLFNRSWIPSKQKKNKS